MEVEIIKERRVDNIYRLKIAKINLEHRELELKRNLEYINDVLPFIKKLKKIKYCFNYIKANWYYDKFYEDEINNVERRIKDYLQLYKVAILKRKILKLKLKQAQREFSRRGVKKWEKTKEHTKR